MSAADAGLVIFDLAADRLRAAIVFAPDLTLADAAVILPICGVGLQNAIGALGPPEVSVHFGWDGIGLCQWRALWRVAHSSIPARRTLSQIGWSLTSHYRFGPKVTRQVCSRIKQRSMPKAVPKSTRFRSWRPGSAIHLLGSIHGPTAVRPKSTANGKGWHMVLRRGVTAGNLTGTYVGLDDRLGLLLKIDDTTTLIPLTTNLTRPHMKLAPRNPF